jgi:hypothetical protein
MASAIGRVSMSENEIVPVGNIDAVTVETVLVGGDLSKLTPAQRVSYYTAVCKSLGLNQLTRPFDYLVLNGKMVLYARRDATDQLRAIKGISIVITARETISDVYVVTAQASEGGRTDESTGAVSIKGLVGDALANAMMKAESKAKRRVTLSIVGLGLSDESEVEAIPGAKKVEVTETGEIVEPEFVIPEPEEDVHREVDTKNILPDATLKELVKSMYDVAGTLKKTTKDVHQLFHDRFGVDKYTELSEEQVRQIIVLLGQ